MSLKYLSHTLLLTLGLVCASCASHNASRQSETYPSDKETLAQWSTPTSDTDPIENWISIFSDPVLTKLVQEAHENNFGLEASAQRANAAAAVARISGSLRYPSLGINLRSNRQKTLANFAPPKTIIGETHSLNLSSQWEIDIWQRIGKAHAASIAQSKASQWDYEALKLSLSGQIAKAWFDATEAKIQYELAATSAHSSETNLKTLEKRYKRGLAEAFALRLTRAQAAATQTAALNRRSQMDARIRILETLLGRYPNAALETPATLPELTETPPASIPLHILQRRPDLRAGASRLDAFFLQDKATQRNWLPSISLTGSGGTLSNEFSNLSDSDFNIWSLAGNLAMPLFQAGRLKAERKRSEANYHAQLAQYKNTALQAFREVETALRAEVDLRELEAAAKIAATESAKAEEQSWSLYERGLVTITSALDSERRALEARSQLLSIRNRRLQNRINLHIALGGDFQQ